jgi:hypothetical protein
VSEKAKVVARVREACPDALIALRSAEGPCTLLYDPLDEAELEAMGCALRVRTGYDPQVINTTLFYQADPARQERPSAPRMLSAGPAPS